MVFRLFTRYKDGQKRPRFKYGSQGVRLQRAYLRLNAHSVGPCVVEITRMPFDFNGNLTVIEHLVRSVTMVADAGGRLAPMYSGLRLQMRKS